MRICLSVDKWYVINTWYVRKIRHQSEVMDGEFLDLKQRLMTIQIARVFSVINNTHWAWYTDCTGWCKRLSIVSLNDLYCSTAVLGSDKTFELESKLCKVYFHFASLKQTPSLRPTCCPDFTDTHSPRNVVKLGQIETEGSGSLLEISTCKASHNCK